LNEIWKGKQIEGVSGIIRYSCSACNLQPWFVHRKEDRLYIYRIYDGNRRGIMPKNKVIFYNKIDMGIFLCFLNLCLVHEKIPYEMEFQSDTEEQEKNLYAIYKIKTSS
ncbi:MAG: nitroreductase, partial [Erysipelotrichaceae bacterium]|nr:nitroreductase [Erysipelotrichaceae bacterium]